MKKTYKKPQMLVESLLASQFYAAGCAPLIAQMYQNSKTPGQSFEDWALKELYWDLSFSGAMGTFDGVQYCYQSGGDSNKMMAS